MGSAPLFLLALCLGQPSDLAKPDFRRPLRQDVLVISADGRLT